MMSSLYIGATGMIALGQGMQTISNNLSNLNTVGFKERLQLYQDLVSSPVPTPSSALNANGLATSYSQMGHGVMPSNTVTRFYENGSLQAGDRVTDLCIGGKGFFKVTGNDGKTFYSRAGNFYFNKEGFLVNPNQLNLMGKRMNNGVAGALEPIQLKPADMSLAPKATTSASIITALGFNQSSVENTANPFFALALNWNGQQANPYPEGVFTSSIPVYDAAGNKHDVTVSYDLAQKTSDGRKIVNFTVTMNPQEDGRAAFENTSGAGMLMSGTMTFTSGGVLQNMSAYQPSSGATIGDLSTWKSVAVGANGMPINATFKNTNATGTTLSGPQSFTLDFGLGFASPANSVPPNTIGNDPNKLPGYTANGNNPPNVATKNRSIFATGTFATLSRASDGYANGAISHLNIDRNGTIVANYTNRQNRELYQIPLYNFINEQGLKADGNNLFSETMDSGAAREGKADTENFGAIYSTALEMSNVDLARQFSHMISTQRGFQFNSKVITTSDAMLQKALELKRT